MTGHKQFSIDVNYVCDTASLNHDTEYVSAEVLKIKTKIKGLTRL